MSGGTTVLIPSPQYRDWPMKGITYKTANRIIAAMMQLCRSGASRFSTDGIIRATAVASTINHAVTAMPVAYGVAAGPR